MSPFRSKFALCALAASAFVTLAGCGSEPPPPPQAPPQAEPPPPPAPPPAEPPAPVKAEPAPPPEPPKAEPPPAPAPPPKPPELVGKLVSRVGKDVTIEGTLDPAPEVGKKASLYRYFEQQLGPLSTSGWLGIAEVTVKKVDKNKIVFTVVEEKSNIVMNGKKVNHFQAGTKMKIDFVP